MPLAKRPRSGESGRSQSPPQTHLGLTLLDLLLSSQHPSATVTSGAYQALAEAAEESFSQRKTTQKQLCQNCVYVPLKIPIVGLIALCKIKILCNLVLKAFDKLVDKGLSVYCRSMSID